MLKRPQLHKKIKKKRKALNSVIFASQRKSSHFPREIPPALPEVCFKRDAECHRQPPKVFARSRQTTGRKQNLEVYAQQLTSRAVGTQPRCRSVRHRDSSPGAAAASASVQIHMDLFSPLRQDLNSKRPGRRRRRFSRAERDAACWVRGTPAGSGF